ncbi:MAG TPA: VOC family protein [Balneolaceae bacterium]
MKDTQTKAVAESRATKLNQITACIWFDDQAEEAAKFYTSIFRNSNIKETTYYKTETPSNKPKGSVLTVAFDIEGYQFVGLNGGAQFKPTPSISFFINCETEVEVDEMWQKLSEGGKVLMPLDKYDFSEKYGWIEDKYGVSWQVILSKSEGDWRPKIIPSLLFTGEKSGKTKEAIDFYTSVFDDAKEGMAFPYEEPEHKGKTAFADFMLEGQWFAAMDSPEDVHDFDFNEALSFYVSCKDQEEIDYFWEKLSAVPESEVCGWLKDKFGISWQIVPENIMELIDSKEAMEAMMQMKKLDIKRLQQAR